MPSQYQMFQDAKRALDESTPSEPQRLPGNACPCGGRGGDDCPEMERIDAEPMAQESAQKTPVALGQVIGTYEAVEALPDGVLVRDAYGDFALKLPDSARTIWNSKDCVWQVLGDDRDRDGDLDLAPAGYFVLPVQVLWLEP